MEGKSPRRHAIRAARPREGAQMADVLTPTLPPQQSNKDAKKQAKADLAAAKARSKAERPDDTVAETCDSARLDESARVRARSVSEAGPALSQRSRAARRDTGAVTMSHSRGFWFALSTVAALFYTVGVVTILSPVVEPTWLAEITPLEHLLLHSAFLVLGALLGSFIGVIATLSYRDRSDDRR
jgi:hypothetical protein